MRMRSKLFFSTLLALSISNPGFAQEEGEVLVQVSRCFTCHHVTDALLGPPYTAVAARHGQNKGVMVDVLAEKIILGGGGNWGLVPMVPNEHVSKEDARKIAEWILNLN
jgi:cytochrome c